MLKKKDMRKLQLCSPTGLDMIGHVTSLVVVRSVLIGYL